MPLGARRSEPPRTGRPDRPSPAPGRGARHRLAGRGGTSLRRRIRHRPRTWSASTSLHHLTGLVGGLSGGYPVRGGGSVAFMQVNDITRDRLRRLAEARTGDAKVLSLFVNLDPREFATPPARQTEMRSVIDRATRL